MCCTTTSSCEQKSKHSNLSYISQLLLPDHPAPPPCPTLTRDFIASCQQVFGFEVSVNKCKPSCADVSQKAQVPACTSCESWHEDFYSLNKSQSSGQTNALCWAGRSAILTLGGGEFNKCVAVERSGRLDAGDGQGSRYKRVQKCMNPNVFPVDWNGA